MIVLLIISSYSQAMPFLWPSLIVAQATPEPIQSLKQVADTPAEDSLVQGCDQALKTLMSAEYMRLKGQYEQALFLLETFQADQPDCEEVLVLIANILFELHQKKPGLGPSLLRHLNRSIRLYPQRFEFRLMAVELCLYGRSDLGEGCDLAENLSHLNSLNEKALLPNWAQSQFLEFRGEIQKRAGLFFEAAENFHHAWDLDRENLNLLSESARMYHNYGMFRSAYNHYQKAWSISKARTGQTNPLLAFRYVQTGLIIKSDDLSVLDLLRFAPSEHLLFETAEMLLRVGQYQTCRDLLNMLPRISRLNSRYQSLDIELAKRNHNYAYARKRALTALQKEHGNHPFSKGWNQALAQFLDTCNLAGTPEKALAWAAKHEIRYGQLEGYSRILLALILSRQKSDLALWNQTFYNNKLSPSQTQFRADAERLGLDLTQMRLIFRQFTYYRDQDRVRQLGELMLQHSKATFELRVEIADSFAIAGAMDHAFTLYEELLKEQPNNALILNNYGYFLLSRATELPKAEQLIRQTIDLAPDRPAYLDSLAWLEYKLGNYQKALTLLEPVIQKDDKDAVKLVHMGYILSALGEHELARDYWSRAILRYPNNFYEILDQLDPEP